MKALLTGLVAGLILLPVAEARAEVSFLKSSLELPAKKRQRLNAEELLGFDRWRRFEAARFDMDVHNHDFTPRLADQPDELEDLEEIVVGSFLRLGHKRVQRQLNLIERRDILRAKVRGLELEEWERARDRPGVDLSPQFNYHSGASIGAKVSLDGRRSRFWNGAVLQFNQEIDGPDSNARLSFRDDWRSVYLVYHSDHRKRGETIELGFRIALRSRRGR